MAQGRWWLFGLVALLPLVIAAGFVERPLVDEAATLRLGAPLIALLWGWLFAALVLGVAIGGATWRPASPNWTDRPVHVALAVLGLALLLAIAGWPARRAGHWLDLSLLMVAAYLLGCWIGWGLREVAEAAPGPEVARALAQSRGGSAFASAYGARGVALGPSEFGRPAYLSKPGREPFFVPGTGITDPREAAAMAAARDAAAGIVRPPAAPPAPRAVMRPAYLSKPGRLPFYLPGAGITDPRSAVAMHPVWHEPSARMAVDAAPAASASPETGSRIASIPATPAAVPAAPSSPLVTSSPSSASASPVPSDAPAATSATAPVPPASSLAPPPPTVAPAVPSPLPAASSALLPLASAPLSVPEAQAASAPQASVMTAPREAPHVSSAVAEPLASPPVVDQEKHAGARPPGLVAARGAAPDRLQRIKGIGPQNEVRLNALGIWHFAQIAAWTRDHKTWVGSYLAFPGRIDREQWIEQAQVLAAGGAGVKDTQRPRRPRA